MDDGLRILAADGHDLRGAARSLGVVLGRRTLMIRHTPRSTLGLAMLLVSTGAECVSAAPALDKMKRDEAEKRHRFTQHIEGAYGIPYTEAAQKVAANLGGEAVGRWYRDGKLIKEVRGQRLAVSLMESPPVMLVPCPEGPRPAAKPRSKSGQRRAHARWGR